LKTFWRSTTPVIYGITIMLAACLMFLIEPFVAKLLLPSLGGGPNVWNTCVLFFQTLLLAGYVYAHLISTRLKPTLQFVIHLFVLWLPVVFLPVKNQLNVAPSEIHPLLWLFLTLSAMVGALFFAISTTAPLLQKWYAGCDAAGAEDPYFLYAASNVGGVLGLVAYPLVVEPNLSLGEQSHTLAIAYFVFAVLVTICGVYLWLEPTRARTALLESDGTVGGFSVCENQLRDTPEPLRYLEIEAEPVVSESTLGSGETEHVISEPAPGANETGHIVSEGSGGTELIDSKPADSPAPEIGRGAEVQVEPYAPAVAQESVGAAARPSSLQAPNAVTILRWLVLTIIPSSLVLGLTSYVTSELSSIPLFWAVPLLIYMISFIVAFGRFPRQVLNLCQLVAPLFVFGSVMLMTSPTFAKALYGPIGNVTAGLSIHLLSLFFVCTACHGIVAAQRPATKYLTEFYLIIAIGGVLGSAFNTLAAPFLCKAAEEYPAVLIAAGIMLVKFPAMNKWRNWLGAKLDELPVWVKELVPYLVPGCVLVLTSITWISQKNLFHTEQALVYGGSRLIAESAVEVGLRFVIPFVFCLLIARNIGQFRAGLAVIACFVLWSYSCGDPLVVYRMRNFFGNLSVKINPKVESCELWNGMCLHGSDSLDPSMRGEQAPTAGTFGEIMTMLFPPDSTDKTLVGNAKNPSLKTSLKPMAFIGLGCGMMVRLAKPGQRVDFYEINPQVIELASNPFYFSYLYRAKHSDVKVRLICGDGRMEMQKAPYGYYQLIFSEAYSGSSIPSHLITKEAIAMYLDKLTADGVIVFNIGHQYYDMCPVFQKAASELKVDAFELRGYYDDVNEFDWMVLTRNPKIIELLKKDGYKRPPLSPNFRLWTDDYCSPVKLLIPNVS
jgi:hypothetical protein